MIKTMFKSLAPALAILLTVHGVALVSPPPLFADSAVIEHIPPLCITSQFPYRFSAVLPAQANNARLYFKTRDLSSYYFVQMQPMGGRTYAGIIPATVETGAAVEYVIAAYMQEKEIARSQQFFTLTYAETECPIVEPSDANRPIVVYADEPVPGEVGFFGTHVEWKTTRAFDVLQVLTTDGTESDPQQMSAYGSSLETPPPSQPVSHTDESANTHNKVSILGLPPLSTKALVGIGLGAGAATAAGIALMSKEESRIEWTLDPQDLDDKIKVEIIKSPSLQITCGTVVDNSLYVTNKLSQSISVTSIDYEVILTSERPSGGCAPGRIGTFAPNWAVVVAPGERALVRQWSNEVNSCSGCPYMEAKCRWNSKYIVYTTSGSGEAETEFSSEGILCAAAASKNTSTCTPLNADVEP